MEAQNKMNGVCIVFYVFDDLNRLLDGLILNTEVAANVKTLDSFDLKQPQCRKKFSGILRVDGYFLSVFSQTIKHSELYCRMVTINVIKSLKCVPVNSEINIKCQLVKPRLEILDYAWNRRIVHLVSQRQELEHAMSWLSTLGGAFSALGDNFESCARVAAKISIQQFKIAFQLDEPLLVARCKLYMALSLIQLGKLSAARRLVENQYELAKSFKDVRLQKMCKGIWAKLRFVYKQKNISKENISRIII